MAVEFTKGKDSSLGMDLMRRLSEGGITKAPVEYIEKIKKQISENLEEIIEQGARIRPLMSAGKQVGWVRGIHFTERRMLKRWITEPNDYVSNILLLGTTFNKDEIEDMSAVEIRMLTEVVQQMSAYDSSLFPYLGAYSTTQSSETLWNGKGEQLASWENRVTTMPDGKSMRIMCPSDQARVWVSLCTYRDQSKQRLEENFNALFIVRPWAGKSADPIQHELRGVARSLEVDATEPWERIIHDESVTDKNDGWGHVGDSVEDLMREMKGMIRGDKHEKVMEAWEQQLVAEADKKRQDVIARRKKRGIEAAGIASERTEVFTDKQIRERQEALKRGKPLHPQGTVERREDYELDPTDRLMAKIRRV